MKPIILLAGLGLATLTASASPCTASEFSQPTADRYLEAEQALLREEDAQSAVAILTDLQTTDLNCYEEASVHRMKAAALVEIKEYEAAIAELKPVLSSGTLSASEKAKHAYNIGQLYLAMDDQESAQPYLDMSEKLKADSGEN
ncbi:hypothetical protein [Henriciella aquimarina]|uniref:hypothetical protein n=1 Tax=Henriciella aquimarina TaxID=545261 RepID=UPI000A01863A|nr:hypothetical protein [Henriciella aquimarina]